MQFIQSFSKVMFWFLCTIVFVAGAIPMPDRTARIVLYTAAAVTFIASGIQTYHEFKKYADEV